MTLTTATRLTPDLRLALHDEFPDWTEKDMRCMATLLDAGYTLYSFERVKLPGEYWDIVTYINPKVKP